MFGTTCHRQPAIRSLGDFIDELRTVAATRPIVYGAIFFSESLPVFAHVWYVRSQEHFLEILVKLEMLLEAVGDIPLVTDFWGVEVTNDVPLEYVELARGAFEELMGFARFGEANLIPRETVVANIAKLQQLQELQKSTTTELESMLQILGDARPDTTLN